MKKQIAKAVCPIFIAVILVLSAIFLIGRYGWKLGGFRSCESAGVAQIQVEEDHIRILGFYPGSFPQGFLGYYAEQEGSTLYVGFKFSSLFGLFETGDFDITIPTKGTVTHIVVKSGQQEITVWPKEERLAPSIGQRRGFANHHGSVYFPGGHTRRASSRRKCVGAFFCFSRRVQAHPCCLYRCRSKTSS